MKIKETLEVGCDLAESNFVDSGQCINAFGLALGVGLLVYVFAACPNTSTVKSSMLLSLMFIVLFLALCINLVLRLKVPKGITSHHFNSYIVC